VIEISPDGKQVLLQYTRGRYEDGETAQVVCWPTLVAEVVLRRDWRIPAEDFDIRDIRYVRNCHLGVPGFALDRSRPLQKRVGGVGSPYSRTRWNHAGGTS
jgi:hypothetical protein